SIFKLHAFSDHTLDPALQVALMMQTRVEGSTVREIGRETNRSLFPRDMYGWSPGRIIVRLGDYTLIDLALRQTPGAPASDYWFRWIFRDSTNLFDSFHNG